VTLKEARKSRSDSRGPIKVEPEDYEPSQRSRFQAVILLILTP
jgi:hypothetical protein